MPNQTNDSCKCPSYSCSRHGDCKACMEHHFKKGSKTNCGKSRESEGSK